VDLVGEYRPGVYGSIRYQFPEPGGLVSFMAGHEAGDLAVYWLVSIIVALGRRRISEKAYRTTLFVCALVMTGFGLYLGIRPHF
jgi:hypothetical protein